MKTMHNEIKSLIELYNLPLNDLVSKASKLTEKNFDNKMEFCSIISAKTGKCSENCKYCAQSSHYRTNIETHPLISLDDVKRAALSARDNGVTRFSIVTSGRTPYASEFNQLLKMIETVENIEGLSCCASIGIINEQETKLLKDAGLKRYHHNINTCRSYHESVCTTHSYEDRVNTVKLAQKYGIEVCCGGIIGMGESIEQRIEFALEIKDLNPESVPINFLCPIEGTPFESFADKINEEEIIRTIAIMRIIMPNISLRYAGGRPARLSFEYQELGIQAGIDAMLVGNLLTTIGIYPQDDYNMISKLGKKLTK